VKSIKAEFQFNTHTHTASTLLQALSRSFTYL